MCCLGAGATLLGLGSCDCLLNCFWRNSDFYSFENFTSLYNRRHKREVFQVHRLQLWFWGQTPVYRTLGLNWTVLVQVFTSQHSVRDQLIKLGTGRNGTPVLTLRLVEIRCGKTWYSYITSVLDPVVLAPYVIADLYRRRWRIEEAFNTVKRCWD